MNLKTLLLAILDAAVAKWPDWAGLFNLLRPFLASAAPDNGDVVTFGAAPADLTQIVVDFLTGLMNKASRPLVKIGLRALISLTPGLLDSIWSSIFPDQPKPVFAASGPVNIEAVMATCDYE